jgi:hypothetical protein
MHRTLTIATALAVLSVQPALAHPGGHGHLSFWNAIAHLAEPYHLGVFAAAVVVAGVAVGALSRRRATQRTPKSGD